MYTHIYILDHEEETTHITNEDPMDTVNLVVEAEIDFQEEKPLIENLCNNVESVIPLDVVSAAEKIISFYEENKMLTKKELSVIKKAKELAQNMINK